MAIDYGNRIRKAYPILRESRFWRAEDDSAELPTRDLLGRIRTDFPRLKWRRCRRMKRSNDYVVLLLDDKWIFRFTQGNEQSDIETLLRELEVLDLLRGKLRIPVPGFQFRPNCLDYVGYSVIPGTLLSPWRYSRLSLDNKEAAASDLAHFLGVVHAFPTSQATSLGVRNDNRDWPEIAKSHFKSNKSRFDQDIAHTCRRWLEDHRENRSEQSLVFVHNDIYPYHIIHDPTGGRLTGIIDWADHAIADRAKDFSGLWFYGEDFVDSVLSKYPHSDRTLKERSLKLFKLIATCCCGGRKTDPIWPAAIRRLSGL